MSCVQDLLAEGTRVLQDAHLESPRLDAERLLPLVLQRSRTWLLTHFEFEVSDLLSESFRALIRKRSTHYPLQYLEGVQEFFGRPFLVDERVLIPRPETELLVETSLDLLRGIPEPRIIDIGTGSGCLAVSLACELPSSRVLAGDTSAAALDVARENALRNGVSERVELREGRTLEPFADIAPVNLIVSNPPYVADDDPLVDLSVRRFEPSAAVFSGPSGLEIYREILTSAAARLLAGASLVIELGFGQAAVLSALAEELGWSVVEIRKDLAGIERCAVLNVSAASPAVCEPDGEAPSSANSGSPGAQS